MNLDNFFNPKSIAVIGVSSVKSKVGYAIIANLSRGEASRSRLEVSPRIYPVSISEPEILGLKTYKSVKDIVESVDLAVIAVRSDIVPSILSECGDKDIKNAIIISAGFREIGPVGKDLEEKCAEIAKKNNIALLGPNCLGTIDLWNNFNCSFSAQNPPKGNITFLSQSGALGTAMLDLAIKEGVGFSKFISLGNEAQLTEIEFLEYLAKDKDTKSILIYLEKLTDGKKFIELASEITKTKPVVVLKAGRSKRGQEAVASHTGSLAPEDSIFSAACKQAGVIAVESIREFFNMAKLFQLGITKPLKNISILTNGGGPSVVATDLVDLSKSLSLVEFSESTKEALKKVLPSMAAVNNPVDIIGDALASRYEEALKILCTETNTEAIIMILTPQMMTEVEATARLLIKYRTEKTIIPVFIGGPEIEPALICFKENGIPNFTFPKDAVEALDNLEASPRGRFSKIVTGLASKTSRPRLEADLAKSSQGSPLDFISVLKTLKDYNLSIPGILVKEKSHIVNAISKIGTGPYVMKAISHDIIHKTDAGVVCLNIKSIEEAQIAWDSIHKKIHENVPQAKVDGIFIQTTGKGKEVIIGMKHDNTFGPTIVFGLGGIFTEVLKDVSMRIAPVSMEMAEQMILEIKGADILTGSRGEKSVDREALAEIIVKISKLALEHPEIKEIDLNPVMITPEKAEIVDVRMMI
ncbi:MAG: acetate--CoA ligase family protein [Candidatus Paceibacterota bacterium]|jgi:acetyltransferase